MIDGIDRLFDEQSYVVVRGFLDDREVNLFSRYMEYALNAGLYTEVERSEALIPRDFPSRFSRYADPLMEATLTASCEAFSGLVGKALTPTYSYSRVYVKGDELVAHVDRPACEYSVTVNVAYQGEKPWPIWMKAPDKEPVSLVLYPGDAVVYKGCEVEHWRLPMTECDVNAQFMLHYVDRDGPNASYALDRRASFGAPSTTRN